MADGVKGLLSWVPTLVLAPLLFVQGVYVRRVTPKLPEAPGSRCGAIGVGQPIRLLILGDSAAAGVGASSQSTALSGRLAGELAADFAVHWQLLAESGLTTRDLIARLADHPPEAFDVVIVSIGVNDVIAGSRTKTWTDSLAQLLDRLVADFGGRHILISALPPMHRFTALPQPLRWCIGLRAQRFNHELRRFAGRDGRCTAVSLNYPWDPAYLASDRFHPGEPAYLFWARALADAIRGADETGNAGAARSSGA